MSGKKELNTFLWVLLILLTAILSALITARATRCMESHEVVKMDYDPLEVIVEHEYVYTPLSVDYEAYDGLPLNVEDAVMLAQMAYGEYRNADNYEQATATMWCVLNRVDSPLYPNSVEGVIKQPGQFHGYSVKNPVDAKLYDLAVEVLKLWESEKLEGHRTLPKEYLYFSGDGTINQYRTQDGKIYDWNMEEIK